VALAQNQESEIGPCTSEACEVVDIRYPNIAFIKMLGGPLDAASKRHLDLGHAETLSFLP
jgi:hypothetical protein